MFTQIYVTKDIPNKFLLSTLPYVFSYPTTYYIGSNVFFFYTPIQPLIFRIQYYFLLSLIDNFSTNSVLSIALVCRILFANLDLRV